MAAIPDQGAPGDSPAIDPTPYVQAFDAGYSYQDVSDHHDANGWGSPPRADLSDIWAGSTAMDAGWSQPGTMGGSGDSGKGSDPVNDALHISDEDAASVALGGAGGAMERIGAKVMEGIGNTVQNARVSRILDRLDVLQKDDGIANLDSGSFFGNLVRQGETGTGVRKLVTTEVEDAIGHASETSRVGQLVADTSQAVIDAVGSRTAKVVAGAASAGSALNDPEGALRAVGIGPAKRKVKANE